MFWGPPLARERCDTMDGTGPKKVALNYNHAHLGGKPPDRNGPRNRPQNGETIRSRANRRRRRQNCPRSAKLYEPTKTQLVNVWLYALLGGCGWRRQKKELNEATMD